MELKPFYQIAIPHDDIKEGKFTLDTFAADLWSVYKNKGPEDYRNPELFWERTYITSGLSALLEIARKRLLEGIGDAVIQLQTPFGGGKTHSLIALYHKAREWGANVVVLDGTAFDAKEIILWEELERQLTGSANRLNGNVAPGKIKLSELLEEKAPVLILVDELLEYMVKAAGVTVGETTLADQTLAFIHELTEVVKSTDRVLLVMTLPSSILEHYSEKAEEYFQKLQKIAGRSQKVFTPVQEEEVHDVIRTRLFKRIDETEMEAVVKRVVEYLEKEGLIPEGLNAYQYRQRFLRSYPFQPEVIDVLYHRWGSLPKFQRTRGVLRLLSIVVHSLIGRDVAFIRLSDFDLNFKTLRDELIDIIGESRYYSVLDADVLSPNAGAKRVDRMLGESYEHYRVGTRAATVIFMYSFSGGDVKGATPKEIKLSCADTRYSSSIVGDAILYLKDNLLYLHYRDGRYFFSLEPSLNKLVVDEMNNVSEEQIREVEHELLRGQLKGRYFKIYLWPSKPVDVPDSDPSLKLVVLPEYDKEKVLQILQSYGGSERVHKNTLIFLVPRETERASFNRLVRRYLAWKIIDGKAKKGSLELTSEQKDDVKENLKRAREDIVQKIAELYRMVLLSRKKDKDKKKIDLEVLDLGMKPVGIKKTIEELVYEKLREEGKLVEKMAPVVIEMKYLDGKDYVSTKALYESFLKTPGMPLLKSKSVLIDAIKQGVSEGRFGLGYLTGEKVTCEYLGEKPTVTLDEKEVIVNREYCEKLRERAKAGAEIEVETQAIAQEKTSAESIAEVSREQWKPPAVKDKQAVLVSQTPKEEASAQNVINSVHLHLKLGQGSGGLRDVLKALNLLKSKFETVTIEIQADNGSMSEMEYENLLETFRQLNIDVKELKK
ncbi:ATP-binding protein [Thermococcus sp.]